jgi:hypothetical protein
MTLLNADFKIMARIISNTLPPWLADLLQPSQHCGVQDNTALDAIDEVREAVSDAETTKNAQCILSLDFKAAFDNISHTYLFKMFKAYAYSERFQQRIKSMYEGSTSSVQINGHISSSIPIKCSIRQGVH